MRALKGATPRAFKDHRRAEARLYAEYIAALVQRSGWKAGRLPADVRSTLRDAGRLLVEGERLAADLEDARSGTRSRQQRRLKDARRIRRELTRVRGQRLALERHALTLLSATGATTGPLDDPAAAFLEQSAAVSDGG